MKRFLLSSLAVAMSAAASHAHFPMLWHDGQFASVNETVRLFYALGHPYEQEYEQVDAPERVLAHRPDGSVEDLTDAVSAVTINVDGMSAPAWTFDYTTTQAGDSVIALDASPTLGLNFVMFQEFVKVVIHAVEQTDWDARTGQPIEIVPLTRPYGLEAGYVFTGRLMQGDEPLEGVLIEIEQSLDRVPAIEDLPPEPIITKAVKTGPGGVFSHTLPHAGWWIIAAEVDDIDEVDIEGEIWDRSGLAALWVYVGEPFVQTFPTRVMNWRTQ